MEAAAEAALELLEVAGRLWNACLSIVGNSLLVVIVDIARSQEASWCERLVIVANHAVASLEAGLGNVEVTASCLLLLLVHGSFILLGEDEAGLWEEHVGGFGLLRVLTVQEARKVDLMRLLGLLRRGNILDEALLDLGSEAADQD